jgi:Ca2+-binding RTX toxin-like protein
MQPQKITLTQLQSYSDQIKNGGLQQARQVYADLYAKGYNYAGWAQGVATGETFTGVAALDFLTGTALLGVGSASCRNLSSTQIDSIRLEMAKGYLDSLLAIARKGGDQIDRDVRYDETKKFHAKAFEENGLGIDNWTLNTPMELIRKTRGDAAVEEQWSRLRDTGGTGLEAMKASMDLMTLVGKEAFANDPQAQQWIENAPGTANWDALVRSMDVARKLLENILPSGDPYGGDPATGTPWPGSSWDELADQLKAYFEQAQQSTSPLLLDLDGDGVETIASSKTGVHFDLDNSGFAEQTGWAGKDDGLLARDLNGDGEINNGAELFGNHTALKNGQLATNGFEALKELDTNGDGVIDAKDSAFATLRVWRDLNSNGVTEAGELQTLEKANVRSLNVGYASDTQKDAQGNEHRQLGSFTRGDGRQQKMDDVWFSVDTARTVNMHPLAVSAQIAALPDLPGMGNVASLHQAMAQDSTGTLTKLVQQWMAAGEADRPALLTELIFHWAGVQNSDPASRAARKTQGNVSGDTRKLETLEKMLGADYLGNYGGEKGLSIYPLPTSYLNEAFALLAQRIKVKLQLQSDFRLFVKTLALRSNVTSTSFEWDVSHLLQLLQAQFHLGWESSKLPDFYNALIGAGRGGISLLVALSKAVAQQSIDFKTWSRLAGITFLPGKDDAATLQMANGVALSQLLLDGPGNDTLRGSVNADLLAGNKGNDLLEGGAGNDTYVFNKGDGADSIDDSDYTSSNIDTLQLGAGLLANEALVSRIGGHLKLSWGNDSVTVKNYFYGSAYWLEKIQFADGTAWTQKELAEKLIQNGTAGADAYTGLANYTNIMNGLDGDDTLIGGDKSDILNGGKGNDILNGGLGNDAYLFNKGDGIDTIADYDDTSGNIDTLLIGPGLTPATTVLARSGNHLTLTWGSDSIIIQNYFYSTCYGIDRVVFADGTVWTSSTIAPKLTHTGTNANDYWWGRYDQSNRMFGLAGDDTFHGGQLADTLDGGEGNDSLFGNAGNDTLIGGRGDDFLRGSTGDDTYLFNQGDGADYILDEDHTGSNIDTLRLGPALNAAETVIARSENSLTLSWGLDSINIQNYFYGAAYDIEKIIFSDGTTWTHDDIAARITQTGTSGNDYWWGLRDHNNRMFGMAGDDHLYGGQLADTLDGGEGNDALDGGAGNDSLAGGKGNDSLTGGSGNDTYLFNPGDGTDSINDYDYDYTSSNIDTLKLGSGLTAANTLLARSGDDLTLAWGTDSVIIGSYFYSAPYRIEKIIFADGATWAYADIAAKLTQTGSIANDDWRGLGDQSNRMFGMAGHDRLSGGQLADTLDGGEGNDSLFGNAGNDTLIGGNGNDALDGGDGNDSLAGGTGNDSLTGGSGNDTYLFNPGDGTDSINDYDYDYTSSSIDTLKLGVGLTTAKTVVNRSGNNLTLTWGADSVIIENYFYSAPYKIEKIVFADGATWAYADIAAKLTQTGSIDNDDWRGLGDQSNRMFGMAGHDRLYGGQLADTLDGGEGNDSLIGDVGNDTLIGGKGNDSLDGGTGNDTYRFSRGDGVDTITDSDSTKGNFDVLELSGINQQNLWFRHTGNDLQINVLGSSDQITVKDWYAPNPVAGNNHIERIRTAEGYTLLDGDVDKFVEAMAGFAAPSAAQTSWTNGQQSNGRVLLTVTH